MLNFKGEGKWLQLPPPPVLSYAMPGILIYYILRYEATDWWRKVLAVVWQILNTKDEEPNLKCHLFPHQEYQPVTWAMGMSIGSQWTPSIITKNPVASEILIRDAQFSKTALPLDVQNLGWTFLKMNYPQLLLVEIW